MVNTFVLIFTTSYVDIPLQIVRTYEWHYNAKYGEGSENIDFLVIDCICLALTITLH